MKNYYDELEVSQTASKEVIERVYKVLAKKYHPDTTKEANKQAAEEKFKIISEAYDVLSNDEKRKKYDLELEKSNPTISYQDYMNVVQQRDNLNNSLRGLQNEFAQYKNSYNATATQYNRNAHTQYQQSQFNQTRYNQTQQNFNNGFNNYQRPNMNQAYNNPNVRTRTKKYYYNSATGQPVSSFQYFKYKMRNFISNMIFYAVLIFLFFILLKNVLSSGINSLLS